MSFSQPAGLFIFDKADLLQNLPGSCPEIAQASDGIVINYLACLDKSDVITGVTLKIIEFLPDGDRTRASSRYIFSTRLLHPNQAVLSPRLSYCSNNSKRSMRNPVARSARPSDRTSWDRQASSTR